VSFFVPFYIYLKIPTKGSKPFLSSAKTFCNKIVTGYIGFYHLKFVQMLYLILFSIVQKKCQKKREERTLKTKVLRKLKKESVGKKGVRSDCWYAQVFEP
jgi:hypothetical protein